MSSLKVDVALSRTYLQSDSDIDEPLYALLSMAPEVSSDEETSRAALNMVFVIDASATMHDLQLTDEQREHWRALALSRDELQRGKADGRDVVYYVGQTLAEMQSVARKPMAIVVDALKEILASLQHNDRISVVAFADRVHTVFSDDYWQTFPSQCGMQLDALRDQRLPADIGTGTFMADAIRTAGNYLEKGRSGNSVNRLIIISDGIVQDAMAALTNIEVIQQRGFPITTIGVGQEFDDTFLIRIADNSRGAYHYAADKSQIVDRLHEELKALQTTSITDLYVAVRGLEGSVVQDIYQVRPSMNIFDEIYTEDDWLRARIGDVSSAEPAGVLVQLSPALHAAGPNLLANILLTWSSASGAANAAKGNSKISITVDFGDDSAQLESKNKKVMDLVDRFQVFKLERDAQRAQDRGDVLTAKEKLGAATRQLQKMGETALAQEMQSQIDTLGTGRADPARIKRIRATTRRLANATTSGSGSDNNGQE